VVHLQRGESEALGASGGPPILSEQQMCVLRGDFIAHMFWYKKVRWRGIFYGAGLSRILVGITRAGEIIVSRVILVITS